MLNVHQIINTPVSSNCFVLFDKEEGDDCIVVDPGSESDDVLFEFIEDYGLNPKYIILTHEHFDHCWGVVTFKDRYPNTQLVCSKICSEAIQCKKKNYSVFNKQPGFEIGPADILLDDLGWLLLWNDRIIKFEPAKGHSAAGILFFVDRFVFTGDTLIKDLRTVTKLKTASKEALKDSIYLLAKEKGKGIIVCPGHGEVFGLDGYDLTKAL